MDGTVSYGFLWRISKKNETRLDECECVSNSCYDKQQLEVDAIWDNTTALVCLSKREYDQGVRR